MVVVTRSDGLRSRYLDASGDAATLYVRGVNGVRVELLTRTAADHILGRLERLTIDVAGGLDTGYSWAHYGSIPTRRYSVRPLAAPYMPFGGAATIQLWFPAAEDGLRLVRFFSCWLPDGLLLYLAGCCLWSRRDTGRGAQAAVIYGPDGVAYRIEEATRTCGQIPPVYLELLRNSESTFRSSDPLPA